MARNVPIFHNISKLALGNEDGWSGEGRAIPLPHSHISFDITTATEETKHPPSNTARP